MRRICAMALAMAVLVQPVFAEGPLTRSVAREAARLAADSESPLHAAEWRAMRGVEHDTPIVVTTAGRTIAGRFYSIDAHEMVIADDVNLARIPLDEIALIVRPVRRGSALGAALATVGGLWLGSMLAVQMTYGVRCQPGCGGVEAAMLGSIVGIPIAAGYGVWRGTSHVVEEILYRRPSLRP